MGIKQKARRLYYARFGLPPTTDFSKKIAVQDELDISQKGTNGGDDACELMVRLYNRAARKGLEIRHITGSFHSFAYDRQDMIDALDECIKSEVKITAIVTDRDFENNNIEFVEKILNYPGCRIHKAYGASLPHMIMLGNDGASYRLETDEVTRAATYNFNDPDMGSFLKEEFDYLYERASSGAKLKMSYAAG